MVRRRGWTGLSMQGLPGAACVSRQLVYEQLVTGDDLDVGTLIHPFERTYARTASIVSRGTTVGETVREALTALLGHGPD